MVRRRPPARRGCWLSWWAAIKARERIRGRSVRELTRMLWCCLTSLKARPAAWRPQNQGQGVAVVADAEGGADEENERQVDEEKEDQAEVEQPRHDGLFRYSHGAGGTPLPLQPYRRSAGRVQSEWRGGVPLEVGKRSGPPLAGEGWGGGRGFPKLQPPTPTLPRKGGGSYSAPMPKSGGTPVARGGDLRTPRHIRGAGFSPCNDFTAFLY